MNTEGIISAIDEEIANLTQARELLSNGTRRKAGRPSSKGFSLHSVSASASTLQPKRKSGMSPEGRKRIAEAMKKRWAEKRSNVKPEKDVKHKKTEKKES